MAIKTSNDKMSRERFVAKLAELFGVISIDEEAEHHNLSDATQFETIVTDHFGLAPSSILQSIVGEHINNLYELYVRTSSG